MIKWSLTTIFAAVLTLCNPVFAADQVTLRLDWSPIGYHSPFFLALERGYYKDVGLDVTILAGKGSGNTVQLVGNGSDTFGFADATVAAKSASVGVPVKVVMGIIRKSPATILFAPSAGIKSPADLKGRTILGCPGQAARLLLPAYLKAVGLQSTDVTVTTVDCNAVFPLLAQGKADAATGFTPTSSALLARAGMRDVAHLDYADAGLILPSQSIIASIKTIETNPDVVRRFVQATARGWNDAFKDVDAAVAALVRANPLLKGAEEISKTELRGHLPYLDTPSTVGKPFGWQSPQDWKTAEKLMTEYMEMKPQASVDNYFTNQFIPKP